MKRMPIVLLTILLTASFAGAAKSSNEAPSGPPPLSPISLGASLSYWHVDNLKETSLRGAIGGTIIGQARFHEQLALEVRISGFASGDSEDFYLEGEGWVESELTLAILPLEAGLLGILPLGEMFSLQAGPGIGYYLFDGEFRLIQDPVTTTYEIDLDDNIGYYFVFGTRVQLARNVALFGQAKYTWVETSVKEDVEIYQAREAIDFNGLAFETGMIFTF